MTVPPSSGLVVRGLRNAIRGPFDLDFAAGRCTALSGPSGAGKSVLLRMIADLDPNEGHVFLDGTERAAMPAPHWRRRVTYVAAEPGWWAPTIAEHLTDTARARELLATVGVDPALIAAPVARLSTGERQRAALVRAILANPSFLLLDEPTAALDEGARRRVEDLLRELVAGGTGLVLVSHDEAQIERLCDARIAIRATGALEAPA